MKKLLADPEYQELLRSIKRKEYDLRLLEIQAILEYVSSDLSPDSLKRVCREYFKKLEQFTGSKVNNDFISSYVRCLSEICFWTLNKIAPKDDFWKIAKQALRECDDNAGKALSDEEFLLAFREQIVSRRVTIPDPLGELRSRAGSLKQLKNHLLLRSNPLDIAYMSMGDFLFNIGNEAAKTTIDTLFPEFEIRFYRYPEAVADVRYSCGNEKNIYFLDCDDLFSFSLANQQFTNLPQLPKYHRHRNFVYDEAGYCLAWCADCIAVYDIARKHWSLIEDLSGDEIAGCAVVGKRLFYLLGGDLSPIALHSCDLQGNKRKLHFSSRRRGGIAEFKGVTNGFTSQLVKNSASSLAFIMIAQNRQQGGLFFFDTEKETLSLQRNLPRMMGMKPYLQKLANGGLFGSNSRGYFMLRDKFEVFLKFTSPNPRQSNPEQARYALVMNDRPLLPCILMQDEILISPMNRLLINLKNPDTTPFIWLPYSDTVVQIAPDQFLLPVHIGVYTFKIKK